MSSATNSEMCFDKAFVTPPFTFLVGPKRTPVQVPRGLVGYHSEPLRLLMENGRFADSINGTAELGHVELEVFLAFCRWIYTGDYAPMKLIRPESTTDVTIRTPQINNDTSAWDISMRLKSAIAENRYENCAMSKGRSVAATRRSQAPLVLHAKMYMFAHERRVELLKRKSYEALRKGLDKMKIPSPSDGLVGISVCFELMKLLRVCYGLADPSSESDSDGQLNAARAVQTILNGGSDESDDDEEVDEDNNDCDNALASTTAPAVPSTVAERGAEVMAERESDDIIAWNETVALELGLRDLVRFFVAAKLESLVKYKTFREFLESADEVAKDLLLAMIGPDKSKGASAATTAATAPADTTGASAVASPSGKSLRGGKATARAR